jgi:thioester reductase-like protein
VGDAEWEYLRLDNPFLGQYYYFEPYDEDLHLLIIGPGYISLNKVNRPDGYDTGDVFAPHPTRKGLWRYIGRADDMIVHVTGLKTNPVPIEKQLEASELIREAMVVGDGRESAGLLLVLAEGLSEGEVRMELDVLIRQVNASAPSHSRVIPELVRILPPGMVFDHTAKRTLKRGTTVVKLAGVIDDMYRMYESGTGRSHQDLRSEAEATALLDAVLADVFPVVKGHSDADLFSLGMNSLIATRLRNALQRKLGLDPPLKTTITFEYPTPQSLAKYLWNASTGDKTVKSDEDEMKETLFILESAKINLRRDDIARGAVIGGACLLTGATGALGAHVLVQLLKHSSPPSLICLIRASSDYEAEKRVDQSLAQRRLPSLKDLREKGIQIQCVSEQVSVLSADVSTVLHIGWPVNFNYTVRSFERPVQSAVDLLNAFPSALHLYISSVSAIMRHPSNTIPEDITGDIHHSLPMGYARSKWIVENLLAHAAEKGWVTSVVRSGQLVGDTQHGVWNTSEACSLVFLSATTLGALPDKDAQGHEVSWLPVDNAAWAIVRLVGVPSRRRCSVWNLVASSQDYANVIGWMKEKRNLGGMLEVVSYRGWVEKLVASTLESKEVPAAKLLEWFKGEKESSVGKIFDRKKLEEALVSALEVGEAGALDAQVQVGGRLGGINGELLAKTIQAWREDGYLK